MPRTDRANAGESKSQQRQASHNVIRRTTAPSAEIADAGGSLAGQIRGDFSEATFERHVALFGDSRLSHPANATAKAQIFRRLQSSYGNHYVQRIVARITDKSTGAPPANGPSGDFYRQIAQRIVARSNDPLRRKVTVGPAGDKYEREADRVAKQVVSTAPTADEVSAQRQELDEEELLLKSLAQRQVLEEEVLQLKSKDVEHQVGLEGGDVDDDVEKGIQSAKGRGQALPDDFRQSMESSFGVDFSGVQVHTGPKSDDLNDSLSASAFTTGQDIFLKKDEYSPESQRGKELLAHELTHVVQQNSVQETPPTEQTEGEELQLKPVQRETGGGEGEQDDEDVDELLDFLVDMEETDLHQMVEVMENEESGGEVEKDDEDLDEKLERLMKTGMSEFMLELKEMEKPTEEEVKQVVKEEESKQPALQRDYGDAFLNEIYQLAIKAGPGEALDNRKREIGWKLAWRQVVDGVEGIVVTAAEGVFFHVLGGDHYEDPYVWFDEMKPHVESAQEECKQRLDDKEEPESVDTFIQACAEVVWLGYEWEKANELVGLREYYAEQVVSEGLKKQEGKEERKEQPVEKPEQTETAPQKNYGDNFLNKLYQQTVKAGPGEALNELKREIGWKLAWSDLVHNIDAEEAEDVFIDALGQDHYRDGFGWYEAMKPHVKRGKEERELRLGQRIEPKSVNKFIQDCAELVWLGYGWGEAYVLVTAKVNAEAVVSHGLDQEMLRENEIKVTDYKEAMAMLRHPLLRRLGKQPEDMAYFFPLYKGMVNSKTVTKDNAMLIVSELIKADAFAHLPEPTGQAFKYMTEMFAARPQDAARWIAMLATAGVTPDTYLIAVTLGNPTYVNEVEQALGHARATKLEQPQQGERTAFDPEKDLEDVNIEYELGATIGGGMKRLDLLEYGFGLEATEEGFQKVEGERFAGYFKEDVPVDIDFEKHRGSKSGIPEKDPGFSRRALAMYELDKWFGAGVIPPTFRKSHKGKSGILMKEVEGKTLSFATKELLQNPKVRHGLSNLYMLDYVAGQNDRHSENVMITKDGTVQGIDNDLAFGKDYEHVRGYSKASGGASGVLVGELSEIDHVFAQKIIERADDKKAQEVIKEALKGLISTGEIEAMIKRLTTLAKALQELETNSKALQKITKFEGTERGKPLEAKFIKKWE